MPRSELVFDEAQFKHPFLEKSSYRVVFARHRVEYLRSIEPFVRKACAPKKIEFAIDYEATTMEVSTTDATRDPYIVVKANDLIQLLSKGVPLEHAARALEDDVFCEIIPTNLLCASEKAFERRRGRISDPKTLKAIELLTKCHIFVSGKAACVVGNYRGLNDAKNILIACFENIHPVFEIKKLIIKRKLERDGEEGDWDRFIPKIKKTHSKSRAKPRKGGRLPEDVRPRKEDLARETGEYYASSANIEKDRAREERRQKREQTRRARLERHIAPDERED